MEALKEKEDIFKSLEQSEQSSADSITQRAQQEIIADLQKERIAWSRSRRKHRKKFDDKVFHLLRLQVVFLFVLIFLQGFKPWGFSLDKWVFGLFVNGCLVYTYALIRYIASDLFNGSQKMK